MRKSLSALLVLGLLAVPAEASTVPKVDHRGPGVILSVGVFDANLDIAPFDRFSVGVTGAGFTVIMSTLLGGALRTTIRMVDLPNGLSLGLTGAIGWNDNRLAYNGPRDVTRWNYVGVVAAYQAPHYTLRASLGPYFDHDVTGALKGVYPIPNIEIATNLSQNLELTVGGNSFLGVRYSFP